ncbi:MAG: 3-hydroxyacyl-CoA dehydrogenase family protein [Bacteroidota bacterium]
MTATDRRVICIVGDPPLVAEYAGLCAGRGYAVQHLAIREPGRTGARRFRLGGNVRLVARPSRTVRLALELSNVSVETKRKNLMLLDRSLPAHTPIVSSSVTVRAGEQAGWLRHRNRLIGIGALPSLLAGSLLEFAVAPTTDVPTRRMAEEFAASLGKEATFVGDLPGLVLPRIVCTLANEAHFAMMEGVAGRDDIDTAMKLGTNYPAGPLEWAERIGYRQLCAVLDALRVFYGEERYRAAPAVRHALDREGTAAV